MKIMNESCLNTAKVAVVKTYIKSASDLLTLGKKIKEYEISSKEIVWISLFEEKMEKVSVGDLRAKMLELEEVLRVSGVRVVVDLTSKRDAKEGYVSGLIFKDIFGRDSSKWSNLGVLETKLTAEGSTRKFVCGIRWNTIKREMESSNIIDSEFSVDTSKFDFIEVKDLQGLKECHSFLKTGTEITLDIETNMIDFAHKDSKILCIQLGIIENPNKVYLIWYDKSGIVLEQSYKEQIQGFMKWVMTKNTVIAHNGSAFDIPWICTHFDIDAWECSIIDTLVLGYIARNSTRRTPLGLKELSYKYVSDYDTDLDVFKKEYCSANKIKQEDFSYDFIPTDILARYSFIDIVALNYIRKDLELECRNHIGGDLYETCFLPFYKDFSKLISYMEVLGMPFDLEKAKEKLNEKYKLRDEMLESLQEDSFVKSAEKKIIQANFDKAMVIYNKKVEEAKAKGKEFKGKMPDLEEGKYGTIKFDIKFNPNSTDHRRVLAFDVLKLRKISDTPAGLPSADGESFIAWSEMRPDISILSIFSKLAKMEKEITGFYEPYITKAGNARDGRVRGFYRINGTISGRISMSDINILQVPRDSDFKYLIGFPKESDYYIVGSDVTSLESNVLTLFSLDQGLLDINEYTGGDGHSFLAISLGNLGVDLFKELKGLNNKDIKDIKYVKDNYPKLRHYAKTANFSCIFGISGRGLARDLGIPDEDGEAIVNGFWKTHKQAKEYFDKQEKKSMEDGYVDLIGGLKLFTPDSLSEDKSLKGKSFKSSNNATIQSSSWVTHRAMIDTFNIARENKWDIQPLTPWHDASYYQVHKKDLLNACCLIQQRMEKDFIPNQLYSLISKPEIGKTIKGGYELDTTHVGNYEELFLEFARKEGII